MADSVLPGLPCPECLERYRKSHDGQPPEGLNRIGNRRGRCDTCNNFAAAVRRNVAKRLAERHAAELDQLRLDVERDLYPGVIEKWNVLKGLPS